MPEEEEIFPGGRYVDTKQNVFFMRVCGKWVEERWQQIETKAYKKQVMEELKGLSKKKCVELLLWRMGLWYERSCFWRDKYEDAIKKEEGCD